MRRHTAVFAGAVLMGLALTGCGLDKVQEPYKDAPRGSSNTGKADTVTMPDGFSNVATKCDHGNRIYVAYKGDLAYGAIAVVPNAKGC